MGWVRLSWLLIVFAAFYIAAPALAHGRRRHVPWIRTTVEAFVKLSFFLHFAILGLASIRMALAGAVCVLYTLWIAGTLAYRKPAIIAAVERLLTLKSPADIRFGLSLKTRLAIALLSAYVLLAARYPVYNLRFASLEGYSRALSLAILSSGQPWKFDGSVPFLEPLMFFSALPATLVVSLSAPLFACLLVLAVAYLASQYSQSRTAPLLAGSLWMLVSSWRGEFDGSVGGRPEMPATFVLLALALVKRAPLSATLAALTATTMNSGGSAAPIVLAGAGCAAAASLLPDRLQIASTVSAALAFIVIVLLRGVPARADGPYQYESAARVCDRLWRTEARNAWAVVSPPQEVPFVYGHGWHVELTSFANRFAPAQVSAPSFRFPYPVRDIFFFVENQPLWPAEDPDRVGQVSINVTYSPDPTDVSYYTPIGRATLEFRAAEILAAYGKSHSDLKLIFEDDHLSVYKATGTVDPQ